MGLERRLFDDEAEVIFEEKKELLKSIGIKEKELEKHLFEARKDYEQYKSVHQLKPEYFASKISEILNLPVTTIQSWTQFGEIPLLLAKRGYFTKKKRKIVENETHDLTFLLGAYAGSKKNPLTNYFSLSSRDESVCKMFLGSIYNLTGLLPQMKHIGKSWRFYYASEHFADTFQKHTLNNTVVPWQLFGDSIDGKRAYLRGFLSTKCSVTLNADNYQPGISIDLARNKSLINEMGVLFSDLGIYPSLTKVRVNITNPVDLKIISDSKLLLVKRKRKQLKEILSGFDSCEENISVEKFLEIRGKLESGQYNRKETRKAFVANGAKYFTAREWVSTNKTPKMVKRHLKLKRIKKEIGDGEVIAYLYEKLGYKKWKTGVAHTKKLAKMLTLDEVNDYQTRQELEKNNKQLGFFLYLREQVGLDWNLSKSLVNDFSKKEIENILFGDTVYKIEGKDVFIEKANVTFWRKYMSKGKKYFSESNVQKEPRGLVNLSHFFNMFVPQNYVEDADKLTRAYRLFYRKVMSHPASSSFVRVENDDFYITNTHRYVNLVETLLSGAGLGGKKRKLAEAKKLTEIINSF